ncbi:MAG TPA: ABC transporter substrate-binding protein [Acidimicrobiales bacterium]
MGRVRAVAAIAGLSVALVATGCSRSGSSSGSTSTQTTVAASTTSGGTFGTLKDVCGPGNAKGATAPGVTNTEIDVSTMADPGNTFSPGLDQELFDTADAFSKWCDAAGGILGRKVVVHDRDSKLFNVAQQTLAACATDFALVGNGEAFDSAGVAPRLKCGLPDIPAYDNSPEATAAPQKVEPEPNPIQENSASAFRAAQHLFPKDTKMGILVGNIAGVTTTGLRDKETAEQLGFTVPYYSLYPPTGINNPQSYVQQMKAAGVQVETLVGDNGSQVALEKAMQTAGWYPDVMVFYPNFYDPTFVGNGGSALKSSYVSDAYYPFELGGQNPPTAQYVNIMKAELPSPKISAIGVQGWDAWMLFAVSVKACGSNLTRQCLLQQASSQAAWTGGGLKPAVHPALTHAEATTCNLIMQATPSGFVPAPDVLPPTPGKGPFNCDPANVAHLKTNYEPTDLPAGVQPVQ